MSYTDVSDTGVYICQNIPNSILNSCTFTEYKFNPEVIKK